MTSPPIEYLGAKSPADRAWHGGLVFLAMLVFGLGTDVVTGRSARDRAAFGDAAASGWSLSAPGVLKHGPLDPDAAPPGKGRRPRKAHAGHLRRPRGPRRPPVAPWLAPDRDRTLVEIATIENRVPLVPHAFGAVLTSRIRAQLEMEQVYELAAPTAAGDPDPGAAPEEPEPGAAVAIRPEPDRPTYRLEGMVTHVTLHDAFAGRLGVEIRILDRTRGRQLLHEEIESPVRRRDLEGGFIGDGGHEPDPRSYDGVAGTGLEGTVETLVLQILERIRATVPARPAGHPRIRAGRIARLEGSRVWLDGGRDRGYAIGDVLHVYRKDEPLLTGTEIIALGRLRVIRVEDHHALARVVRSGAFLEGDLVGR